MAGNYDALSSRRPCKEPLSRERCFEIMEEGRGTQFDPRVLDAFREAADEIVRIQIESMDLHE